MASIRIEGMSFHAHHGCFKEEQAIGTFFLVDVVLSVDTQKAERSDDLHDTVNYADVYQAIKAEMMIPSHLLEHVARRIADRIFTAFPAVSDLAVKIDKCNPPLGGQIRSVSFENHYRRLT